MLNWPNICHMGPCMQEWNTNEHKYQKNKGLLFLDIQMSANNVRTQGRNSLAIYKILNLVPW